MDITKLLFLFVIYAATFAVNQKELQNWHWNVTSKKFNCPAPEEIDLKVIDSSPLLKIVDCGDPLAIYRYEFKVPIPFHNVSKINRQLEIFSKCN